MAFWPIATGAAISFIVSLILAPKLLKNELKDWNGLDALVWFRLVSIGGGALIAIVVGLIDALDRASLAGRGSDNIAGALLGLIVASSLCSLAAAGAGLWVANSFMKQRT